MPFAWARLKPGWDERPCYKFTNFCAVTPFSPNTPAAYKNATAKADMTTAMTRYRHPK